MEEAFGGLCDKGACRHSKGERYCSQSCSGTFQRKERQSTDFDYRGVLIESPLKDRWKVIAEKCSARGGRGKEHSNRTSFNDWHRKKKRR